MKKANLVLCAIFLSIAGYVMYAASSFPGGTAGVPGPGVFPMIIAGMMIASCVGILIETLRMEDVAIGWLEPYMKPVYISMVVVVVYVFALMQIGFVVTSTIFMTGMVQWFKKGKPLVNVLISLVFVGVVYLVFSVVLKVPMNFGILL